MLLQQDTTMFAPVGVCGGGGGGMMMVIRKKVCKLY